MGKIIDDQEIPFGEEKEEKPKETTTPQNNTVDDALHHAGKMLLYDLESASRSIDSYVPLGYTSDTLDPMSNIFVYGLLVGKNQRLVVQIETLTLQKCLEQIYGPELKDSGIYEQIAFPKAGPVDLALVNQYFQECDILKGFNSTFLPFNGTAYRILLRLTLQDRPFFAGVMKEKGWNNENIYAWDTLHTVLSLQDLLQQGKKDNCIPQVGRLWKTYKDLQW